MQPTVYRAGELEAVEIDRVTVNGVKRHFVHMADPRRGVIEESMQKNGMARADKYGKRVLTRRVRGAVVVHFKDGSIDCGGGRVNRSR